MDLLHQRAHGGVGFLVPLDRVQTRELLAYDDRLVVRLQAAAVSVAFIEHFQVFGLQNLQGVLDQIEFAQCLLSQGFCFSSSAVMSANSLFTSGTALSSLVWVSCADRALSSGNLASIFLPSGD